MTSASRLHVGGLSQDAYHGASWQHKLEPGRVAQLVNSLLSPEEREEDAPEYDHEGDYKRPEERCRHPTEHLDRIDKSLERVHRIPRRESSGLISRQIS